LCMFKFVHAREKKPAKHRPAIERLQYISDVLRSIIGCQSASRLKQPTSRVKITATWLQPVQRLRIRVGAGTGQLISFQEVADEPRSATLLPFRRQL